MRYLLIVFVLFLHVIQADNSPIQESLLVKQNLLSASELEYLKNKNSIKVCVHNKLPPFMIKDKKSYKGLAVDFLNLLSNKSGLKFEFVESKDVSDSFKMVQDGLCEVIPVILTKPNRFKFLIPTQAYAFDNIVLVTKINEPYIIDLDVLKNQKVMVLKGTKSQQKYIHSIYPNMNLVEVESVNLNRVANGEFYGHIAASYNVAHQIATMYPNELKIMSKIGDISVGGSFGITVREPVLVDIFNKAISAFTQDEIHTITNSWLKIEVEKKIDYALVWQVIGGSFIIVFIVLLGYFKQRALRKEIERLNSTLEDRVREEVAKNREKDQQMLQQSRLAQMDEMISMIAHQWRQPLAAISAASTSLHLKAELNKIDNQTVQDMSLKISDYSSHLSTTIDDFMGFFKPNKEKKETNYTELIRAVLGIIETAITTKNIQLIQDLECDDTFKSYPNELKQVILNLMKNAEDALLEYEVKQPYIKIATYKEGNNLILCISDNAGGIAEDILDNIFDPYFSTKLTRNGTGLGLYMSKTIVEKHCHGKLHVFNGDEGAVCKIILRENSV